MNDKTIVVLGSGASALVAVHELLSREIRPVVIDLGFDLNYRNLFPSIPLTLPKSKSLKLWFGSDHSYIQPNDEMLDFKNLKIGPSFGFGGFTRVWGATVYSDPVKNCARKYLFNIPNEHNLETIDKILNPQQEISDFELYNLYKNLFAKSKFEIIKPKLALHFNECELSQNCVTGCPNDAIWSSAGEFQKLVANNQIDYLPFKYVKKIEQYSSGCGIFGVDLKTDSAFKLECDYLVLASGALSSAILLVRSGFFPELTLKDSNTKFGLLLDFKFRRKINLGLGTLLSKVWIKDSKDSVLMQIYAPGKALSQRLSIQFLEQKNVLKFFVKLINNRIFPVITYNSTEKSGRIIIKRDDMRIKITTKFPVYKKIQSINDIWKLRFSLLKKGFLLLPMVPSSVGRGFHYGAATNLCSGIKSSGDIYTQPRIVPVDAISLADIPVGGTIYTLMVNASSRVTRLVESIENS